ncbi:ABC transporter ATP-binding protein [Benzoatithermus flavus]|uniref:ATP-binding cassette domain-containing protein n=1 Tax=Benzoatithermus flavus TaxID=3108223 RepID=A0ABU8XVT0_9PROT
MIELRSIAVTFGRGTVLETRALRGIDLSIPESEFVTVIGSNGAGKSTLLNVLAGTVPATEGRIVIDGKDVTPLPAARRARLLARVFQDPLAGTCAGLTIEENLALAEARGRGRGLKLAVRGGSRARWRDRLAELGLGLENRLGDRMGLLSGGQRQCVALLMATMAPSKILLLDEHTAALDPRTADLVVDLTRKLVAEFGLTTLMITHSMHQALGCGSRLLMLHEGRICLDVGGEAKTRLTPEDLLAEFRRRRGEELDDDALLLD